MQVFLLISGKSLLDGVRVGLHSVNLELELDLLLYLVEKVVSDIEFTKYGYRRRGL